MQFIPKKAFVKKPNDLNLNSHKWYFVKFHFINQQFFFLLQNTPVNQLIYKFGNNSLLHMQHIRGTGFSIECHDRLPYASF